jgi:hypothetical protein
MRKTTLIFANPKVAPLRVLSRLKTPVQILPEAAEVAEKAFG